MKRALSFSFLMITTLSGCGDSTADGVGGATSGTTTVSATSATHASASVSGTTGATSTSSGSMEPVTEVNVSQSPCFELATGTANAENPCVSGDLYFLTGANVDLDSANAGEPAYCVKPGSPMSLEEVPTDYASCNWESYVEGGNSLANTGYVVRDRLGAHHYRLQIVSNSLPTLKFRYAKID
jgi:hypothetical protein